MTRRVVAIEGKTTRDGRLLLPGSIIMKKDVIPVMDDGFIAVGKATDFERNDETGEISLDIITKDELPEGINAHVSIYNLVADTLPHSLIIKSGTLVSIFLSMGDSAWPELSSKD